MKYQKVVSGKFISRPNRFIAMVDINGFEETVHVKNTGRCKELLVPGAKVYLADESDKNRKTKYDLIAVEKRLPNGEILLINMDSQAPNQVAHEFFLSSDFFGESVQIKREVKFQNSRFDFLIIDENKNEPHFVEVKGVTLEENGNAMFPDAPTERGVKHIEELIAAKRQGYKASIFFVIQFKGAETFLPNDKTHSEFGRVLRKAVKAGVNVFAFDCIVSENSLEISTPVKISL